jgi:hypothetical protein
MAILPKPIRRPNPAVTTPASCLLPSERHPGACHCWCRRGLLGTCVRSRKSEMSHSCRFRDATERSGLTPHHGPPSAACESDALLRSAASPADLPGYAPRLNGNATKSPDSEPRSSASCVGRELVCRICPQRSPTSPRPSARSLSARCCR